MSTHYADESTTRGFPQQQQQHQHEHHGSWGGGQPRRRREKPFFATSEFLTMVLVIAAIAIAAAVADDFGSQRAWTLITIAAGAYIISRGLSKIGRGDGHVDA
jgi:hypothetical protein